MLMERQDEFARAITLEEGKTLAEARTEVSRAIQTLTLSSEESKRIYGETVPLGCGAGGQGALGIYDKGPLRRSGRHQSLQLSTEPGVSQGGASPGRGELGNHQTRQRHAPFGP